MASQIEYFDLSDELVRGRHKEAQLKEPVPLQNDNQDRWCMLLP